MTPTATQTREQELRAEYDMAKVQLHEAATSVERAAEAVEATPSDPQLAEKASDAQALFSAKERLCEEARDRLELYQATQAARAVAFPNPAGSRTVSIKGEPLTYSRATGHSIFRDMEHARRGDQDAAQRLRRPSRPSWGTRRSRPPSTYTGT
ncbi:MAG: hypothetical protein ACR2G3_10625 [Solirubrobacterales bacterium]